MPYGMLKKRRLLNKNINKIGKFNENQSLCTSFRFDEFPNAAISLIAGKVVVVSIASISTKMKMQLKIFYTCEHTMKIW